MQPAGKQGKITHLEFQTHSSLHSMQIDPRQRWVVYSEVSGIDRRVQALSRADNVVA